MYRVDFMEMREKKRIAGLCRVGFMEMPEEKWITGMYRVDFIAEFNVSKSGYLNTEKHVLSRI